MFQAHRLLAPILLGLCYFVAAALAVSLTRFEGGIAFLWVATAILAADLMSRPPRQWAASVVPCALASVVATGTLGLGWTAALPFALINIVEAVVAAWLFQRFANPLRPLGSLSWLMHFVASVGIVAPIVAAALAALLASLIGLAPDKIFVTFITGHALGNLTFTPIALLLTRRNRAAMLRDLGRRDLIEATVLLMLAAATSALVFWQDHYPLLFLPALPMILIAFRVGRGGVALSIAMLALVGGTATVLGYGPMQLIDTSLGGQLQFFQFYLAASVLTLLPVTADLENRGRLHRKLRESEAGYRLIAEHSSDIIFSLRIDGTIRYVSPSCRQMGYEPAALIGRNCSALIAPEHLEQAAAAHFRSLKMGGETNRFEYLALSASGERRWCESHARLVVDAAGEPNGILSIVRDVHAQKGVVQKLAKAALVDSLTGLDNRLAYQSAIERRVAHANEVGDCVALLDIDHFKRVNDQHGHDAGDIVLRGFADVARRAVREQDIVARIGGEEFAIYFPDTTVDQALAVCERLRAELGTTMFRAGTSAIRITVSGGVSVLGEGGIDEALKAADVALYRAKAAGRNQLALAA